MQVRPHALGLRRARIDSGREVLDDGPDGQSTVLLVPPPEVDAVQIVGVGGGGGRGGVSRHPLDYAGLLLGREEEIAVGLDC